MPLSPLRGAPLLPIGTDDPNERAARLTELNNSNRTALGAGAASGAQGITAGNIASQALDAELAGNPQQASALRQLALAQAQEAAADTAGHVTSYRDIHGVGDALDYAALQAGQAGVTTLPPLAAAVLSRGAGRLATPGAFLGATVPAYQMEKGEAVLNQYQDPTTANTDPQLRERAAQGKGLVNAALESIVPAGLASGFGHAGRSALRTIGTSMLEEGLTEGLQQGVGNIAQEAVKQGGLNHAALMAPFDPANRQGQIDAALAGALGGGGLSVPTAGSQVVANKLVDARDRAVEAAKNVKNTASDALDKTGEVAQDLGTKLKDFSDEQLAAHLAKDDGPAPLAPHTPAEEILQNSTDPEEILRAQDEHEAGQEQHAAQVAQNIAADEHAPADLKARAADFLAGKTPRELMGDLVDQARQVDVTRHAARVRDTATKAIDTAKIAVKSFLDTPLPGAKQSEEETKPVDFAPMVQKLFDGLAPEFKTDPDVRARLKPLAQVLHTIGSEEAPTRRGYALLQDLHDKGVFNLFEDPSKALDFNLQPALEAVTRARTEASRPDSFFTTALTPAFQANPKTRTAVANIIDRAAINNGRVSSDERSTLARAFGSTKAAGTMLRHYASLMPKLAGPITVAEPEQLDEEHVAEDDKTLTQVAPKDTKVQHHFATQDEQPYLALKSEQAPVTKFAPTGQVSPARKAAQLLRDKDPSRNVRVQNMLDYARETGKDPAQLAGKLREQFAEREAQGKARPGEDVIHEAAGASDEDLLRSHEVVRSTQRDNARDIMFDNDPELHAKARVLVDQVRNAKTPEAAAAMRATHFKVYRKVVNSANEIVERPTTYSAESLWKYFGDKQQAKHKDEGGAAASEGEGQRAQNLFSQAIAEIAQDRNVTKIELPEHLVIDRKTGTTLQKDLRVPNKVYTKEQKFQSRRKSDNTRWIDTLKKASAEIADSKIAAFIQGKLHANDAHKALAHLQRVLDIPREEYSPTPHGFHLLALRLKRDELVRKTMREIVGDTVQRPTFEKNVARDGAREDKHETNLARLDDMTDYVSELSHLVSGIPMFDKMLDDAQKELEDLEDAVDKGARKFDETTGEPLVPGDKEAAANASGVKGMARQAQADVDAGKQDIAVPRPRKNPPLREPKTPAEKHAALKFSMEATRIHEQLDREGFAASHDSPHKFDGVFDWRTHAYKGEGAMAYGAGTYLSTSEGVHKSYKEKFTAQTNDSDVHEEISHLESMLEREEKKKQNLEEQAKAVSGSDADKYVGRIWTYFPDDFAAWDYHDKVFASKAAATRAAEQALREVEREITKAGDRFDTRTPQTWALEELLHRAAVDIDVLQDELKTAKEQAKNFSPSPTYQVSVRANDDEILDFDKPFNQQNPQIQSKLRSVLDKHRDSYLVNNLMGQINLGAKRMPTGHQLYKALGDSIGDRETSDLFQAAGIVGHRYASNGSSNDTHPNYVIYDDSRITTNAVTLSKEQADADPLQVDKALKDSIKSEITRMLGKGVKLSFSKSLQGSGEYSPATRHIRLALAANNPLGTAYHEALHDFFNSLSGSEQGRQLRAGLMAATGSEHVRTQLAKFFKDSPGALAQIESDAEERAAYAFQLWAMGKHLGQSLITIGPAGQNIFTRIAKFLTQLFGVVSQDERAVDAFNALYDGSFAEPNEIAAELEKRGLFTLGDKLRVMTGPLADVNDKIMMVATDRLRALGNASTDALADEFMREPGREKGSLPFLPRRARMVGKYKNEIGKLFEGTTVASRREAIANLQALKAPSTPLEHGIRKLLDELYDYQVKAGVKQFNEKTGQWDTQLPKIADYFPRVWDTNKVLNNKGEFIQLMEDHGVSLGQAMLIANAITRGDGQIPLDRSEYQVGYTPFAAGVENRALTFIDKSNAHEFVKFQSSDLAQVLGTYVNQAVHRAEFARQFGNNGARIDAMLDQAAEKLDAKQQIEARTTVKALIGTLGADINPRTRQLMSTAIAAENIILLPLTMFSQVIDAVGVGLRANDSKEAWNAMMRGFKDIGRQVTKAGDDYDTFMAKTLGIIEDASVGDAMGDTYANSGLSAFAKKLNRQFFKWNGMEAWNRGMRTAAMVAGERFIIRNAVNDRYMRELNLGADDIMPMANGRLALTAEQMREVDPRLDAATAAERELRVQEALFRFVDGAVLRPSAANRPVWGSDPHWMLMFHLKQFSFTFQKTILARVANEMNHGNILPAALLMAYVPVIMASSALKAVMTGTTIGDGSMMAALSNGITRSGILGARSFAADAAADLGRGQVPGASFLGPAIQHVWMAGRWAVGDPTVSGTQLLDRSVPLLKYAQ